MLFIVIVFWCFVLDIFGDIGKFWSNLMWIYCIFVCIVIYYYFFCVFIVSVNRGIGFWENYNFFVVGLFVFWILFWLVLIRLIRIEVRGNWE